MPRYDRKVLAAFLVAGVGVALRLAIAGHGYNFDMESYRIVADLIANGQSPYTTERYNYGPIWFNIIHLLDSLPSPTPDSLWALRWKIVAFLTGVDLIIAWLLLRWYGLLPAALFFLNPITILISGYHSQFDNLAILIAIVAVRVIGDKDETSELQKVLGFFLLGVSLIVKHITFMFPIWLCFSFELRRLKLLALFVPIGFFLLSFVPYLGEWHGIARHVFLYHSLPNGPFWKEIAPGFIANKLALPFFFLTAMFLAGLYWRKRSAPEALWLYLTSLVVFSSAIANQYLAIPAAAISVNFNPFYAIYAIFAAIWLAGSSDGLHLHILAPMYPDGGVNAIGYGVNKFLGLREVIFALFLGLVYQEMTPNQRARAFQTLKEGVQWTLARLSEQWSQLRAR